MISGPRARPYRRHARQARRHPGLRLAARHRHCSGAWSREIGCAIIGQTADLAPADKRLYAIRDVTATVESIDLITASILSKKLAAGLDGLVMDVKFGSGAFMDDAADARELADSLVAGRQRARACRRRALLTDMNEPLASRRRQRVEVAYAIDYLTGRRREPRFHEVTVALGAEMLLLGRPRRHRRGGARADRGRHRHAARPPRFSRAWSRRWAGRPICWSGRPITCRRRRSCSRSTPEAPGLVQAIDTRDVGVAVVALGRRAHAAAGSRSTTRSASTDLAGIGDAGRCRAAARHRPCPQRGRRRGAERSAAAGLSHR